MRKPLFNKGAFIGIGVGYVIGVALMFIGVPTANGFFSYTIYCLLVAALFHFLNKADKKRVMK